MRVTFNQFLTLKKGVIRAFWSVPAYLYINNYMLTRSSEHNYCQHPSLRNNTNDKFLLLIKCNVSDLSPKSNNKLYDWATSGDSVDLRRSLLMHLHGRASAAELKLYLAA